jgi:GntR family transcriptional regulator, transcriptional repressor for pyruvate dehydrogenase complex
MLRPIEKQRVADEIVDQIRRLILTGRFAAGEKLPPERTLAKELGVNRASLREALKKLEHMGLVKIRQGDGTRVLDFMTSAGLELLTHLLSDAQGHVQGDLLRDLVEFRRLYGREIARLAAERATPDDVEELRRIAALADDPAVGPEEMLRLDFDFYVALTRSTRNRVLTLLINTTRQAVLSFGPLFARFTHQVATVRRHQRELLDAIAAGDATRAAAVADRYLAGEATAG